MLFTGGLPIPLMFRSQLPSCLQGLWRVLKNTVPDCRSLAAAMLLPVPSLQSQCFSPASTSSEVIRAVLNGRSMSAVHLPSTCQKHPCCMCHVLCVRACQPSALRTRLGSYLCTSCCRCPCRCRCVAVAVAVAVADVHCTAASTLPLCMAVMFCTLSCM